MTIRLTSELCGSGILLRKETRHRLVLGVRLIQQAAAVEIDVNDVAPA